jgi:hypothetical protein
MKDVLIKYFASKAKITHTSNLNDSSDSAGTSVTTHVVRCHILDWAVGEGKTGSEGNLVNTVAPNLLKCGVAGNSCSRGQKT